MTWLRNEVWKVEKEGEGSEVGGWRSAAREAAKGRWAADWD